MFKMLRNNYKDDGSENIVGSFSPIELSSDITHLSTDDKFLLEEIQKQNRVDINDERVVEFLKCRKNPFYFIHNYAQIQEVGGMQLYSKDKMNYKVRRVIKSLFRYHKCMFMASRQLGKMLSLNTPIPLPDGNWTTMGDLKIGDTILDNYGNHTKITAVTETQYNKKCYKVCFDCGEEIIAGAEHLWTISWRPGHRKNITVNTEELKRIVDNPIAKRNGMPYIDIAKPIKNKKKEFFVDPYVLGVWLGDGSRCAGTITIAESDYESFIKGFKQSKYIISHYHPAKGRNSGNYTIYKLITDLRKYNLYMNKHIPREYFSGSIYQRLQLVRGLMDTDGTCNKNGDCEFYQKNHQLILDFQELLASLGIKSRTRSKIINGETYYIVKFCTKRFYVFNFKRKRDRQKLCKNHPKNYRHYIKAVEPIESVPCKCIQVDSPDKLYLCGNSFIPTHNSTIAGSLIAHALTFYPGTKVVIINMDQGAGLENIDKIRFVLENIPDWMKFIPSRSQQHKTYIELLNGSKAQVIYPSTIKTPDQLGRSLTIPILYIDEMAFIRHMDRIYGAAQPTLSTAREQAEKHGYPHYILVTSTPNGSEGDGKFFHDYWMNAIDSDNLFEPDDGQDINIQNKNLYYEKFKKNADDIVSDPSKNSFIRVRYHWSEDPRKDQNWYEIQKKDLNFNERRIGQEIDLEFVGATNCIFPDAVLKQLKKSVSKPIDMIPLLHGVFLKVFKEFNPLDYYIVGVDTASSTEGAFSSVEVFSFKNFEQVAEINVKLGSLTKYGEIVDKLCQYINQLVDGRLIVAIENNSIGKAIIEHLQNHAENDFNWYPYLYYEDSKLDAKGIVKEYGINTNARTKDLMASCLYEFILEGPEYFHSEDLITQLHSITRNNSGLLSSNTYSDCFMAACFCAYARKMKSLDIMPLINFSAKEIENQKLDMVKTISELSSPNEYAKFKLAKEQMFMPVDYDDNLTDMYSMTEDEVSSVFPFLK